MKVIIVTDCFSYEGRCERLCRIVNSFIRSGEYELYAFCTYEDKIEADIISFIPVSGRGGIAECIDLAGLVVGEERFFLVLERCATSVNYEKMLKSHLSKACGITVGAIGTEDNWKNTGIYIVERECLDISEECYSVDLDIALPCAEREDLNIFFA